MNNKQPKKGYGYIYKYTSPSGKSYIGQTVQKLSDRAGHNGKNYLGCHYFWRAIQKYGWQNLTVTILGEFPIDQLNYQEKKYIEIYNTLAPNGYNIQWDEKNYHKGRKIVYQYDSHTGLLIKSWEGQNIAADTLQLNRQALNACLNKNTSTCGGYYWSFQLLEKYPIKEILSNENQQILMYDLNDNFIRQFNSINQAATFINGNANDIRKCCRREISQADNYKWKSIRPIQKTNSNNNPKPIDQLDKETLKIIHTFASISEASRAMQASGTSLIRRAINNIKYSAYGYKWQISQGSTTKDS